MKLLIVANRLPITVVENDNDLKVNLSSGGLVTAISSYLNSSGEKKRVFSDFRWIGWSGYGELGPRESKILKKSFLKAKVSPVNLSHEEKEKYYDGFCNKILWPLFHYFSTYVEFDPLYYESYQKVNEKYAKVVMENYQDGDLVLVQDYHLLLLPRILREKVPNIAVSLFLHTPFPVFEVYRLLPDKWRRELLLGMLGADLIGFHTQDYNEYFLRCVSRILGIDHRFGKIILPKREVKVLTLPLGINFNKYHSAANTYNVKKEVGKIKRVIGKKTLILSVDRLDYTKGVITRLQAYQQFLAKYPLFHNKVVLEMIMIPSRQDVSEYGKMKEQIERIIGEINGQYSTIEWTPISYQYRSVSFPRLTAFYHLAKVGLVTPLRDGMNLVAKEYVASRSNKGGVLILSEMAGAAQELKEALIVNPYSADEIATALKSALEMPLIEQRKRNSLMQERLNKYDVSWWANEIISEMLQDHSIEDLSRNDNLLIDKIKIRYIKAHRRLIFLDYDGTLTPFIINPSQAKPSAEVLALLVNLARENTVFLVSGRDRSTMQQWFGKLPIGLVAEHGAFIRQPGKNWQAIRQYDTSWKKDVFDIIKRMADRVSGSFVEEKEYSLAWHFRAADPIVAAKCAQELADDLRHFTTNSNLQIMEGKMLLEIKNSQFNKGSAAYYLLRKYKSDFILAIGDDTTDEDLFNVLPTSAISVLVGYRKSSAQFAVKDHTKVVKILEKLVSLKPKYEYV